MHPRRRSRNALVPEVASCGRSEGSDGHTPLPKRGPHLRKRTPSRSGRGGRSPGAAGERALRPNVVASPTRPRSSTHSPGQNIPSRHPTEPIEHPTDARPRLPPPVLLPTPARPDPRRLDGSPTGSHNHTNPRITSCPSVAAAPPPAHKHPPELPRPALPGGSRKGGQRNAVAPLPRKPRREAEKRPWAGRRPVRA
jgi:hypothetical protein